jgi:ssDNA-binding Zn-finger/Zn-ribbon topoisomerase 1
MAETQAEATEGDTQVSDGGGGLAVRDTDLAVRREGSVRELVARADLIRRAMDEAMIEGVHYGKIEGVAKPSLFQPGAEKIDTLFRLRPSFVAEERWGPDGHLTVLTKASITHIPSGEVLAEGVSAVCSTYESKYRYRTKNRRCPKCGAEALVKSKKHEGKWQCIGKDKGGCWELFDLEDERITTQEVGRVENEDLADQWETIIRMSEKRSHVAATRMATAASDVFTQDVEDLPQFSRRQAAEDEIVEGEVVEEGGTRPAKGQPKGGGKQVSGAEKGEAIVARKRIRAHANYRRETHEPMIEMAGYAAAALAKIEETLGKAEQEPDERTLLVDQVHSTAAYRAAPTEYDDLVGHATVAELRELLADLKSAPDAAQG